MESIKHKMQLLQKETTDAFEKAAQLDGEGEQFVHECEKFEKLILEINKEINAVEDKLDCHMTSTKEMSEKLEVTSKEANDFELQVGALKRRIALVEGERSRTEEKLTETREKLEEYEAIVVEEEEERKKWDDRGLEAEDGIEIMENSLDEARIIMEESNQKHEAMPIQDIKRRLNVINAEVERAVDRADEVEMRNKEMECRIQDLKEKIKDQEELTDKQALKEDEFDEKVKKLSEENKEAEVRAEFAERTVEKLETTIDQLEESLYAEKLQFRDISLKLDQTLKDMMELA